jgi:hypothetical protein
VGGIGGSGGCSGQSIVVVTDPSSLTVIPQTDPVTSDTFVNASTSQSAPASCVVREHA